MKTLTLLLCSALYFVAIATPAATKPSVKPVPLPAFADLSGKEYAGSTLSTPTVFVFLATDCPVASRTVPQVARLAKAFQKRGARLFAVYPNALETVAGVRRHATERGLLTAHVPVVRDANGNLARALGAMQSPEAVLVGANGAVVYRGSVESLVRAVDALLAKRPIPVQAVRVAGCALRLAASVKTASTAGTSGATAYARIAPVLAKHCVSCHRAGEVAPMPLDTYQSAASWAKAMAAYTKRREMPPWKADSHGEFLDERRLTDAEIAAFERFAACVPPIPPATGRKGEFPNPLSDGFAASRSATEPTNSPFLPVAGGKGAGGIGGETTFTMPAPYETPAEGTDIYRCFVLPTDYDADRWVSKIALAPGNKRIVHHINVWLDTSGVARRLDAADPAPGYTSPSPGSAPGFVAAGVLGGWVPGHTPWQLPEGVGNRLPKGADIVMEVHYVSTGKPETDRSRFTLTWLKGAVRKPLHLGEVSARGFVVPGGDSHYVVNTSDFVREPITLLSVTPHMHYLGRSMKAVARFPDDTEQTLISVSNWDFAWQMSYRYKEPIRLPQNTRIDVSAVFDNSSANPKNPNHPPKNVKNGAATGDEMCNLFIAYTVDGE